MMQNGNATVKLLLLHSTNTTDWFGQSHFNRPIRCSNTKLKWAHWMSHPSDRTPRHPPCTSLHPPDSALSSNSAASRMMQASQNISVPSYRDRLETVLGNVKPPILLARFFINRLIFARASPRFARASTILNATWLKWLTPRNSEQRRDIPGRRISLVCQF